MPPFWANPAGFPLNAGSVSPIPPQGTGPRVCIVMTSKRKKADGPRARAAKKSRSVPPPAPACIDLGTHCTLQDVSGLRRSCLDALDGKLPPVIDGSRVERIDTAALQVLVGFAIDCMERSIVFNWAGRSPALVHGIRLLGIEALLESPGLPAMPMGGPA